MVNEMLTPHTQYALLPADYVRWTEADGTGDPLAHKWPVRRLSRTELATVAVRVDLSVEPPKNVGATVAGWVAMRLRAHETRGELCGRSARHIAAELWPMFFTGPTPRYPYRGFDLLCLADRVGEITGVTVWIDAEPTKAAPYRFRSMRFSDRLTEVKSR